MITRHDFQELIQKNGVALKGAQLRELVRSNPFVVYLDEPLRVVAYRLTETWLTRLPVVEHNEQKKLMGIISLDDLLKARALNLEAERGCERFLTVNVVFPRRSRL